ncbi:hypothetical protein HU200_017335 [Digitaria exilis]|uniref:Uncharacterized protein n=1 Tax=Digitaria exilis TaxID=1010633 RepID=A0A835F6K8_9POAL|nr:hypothetical protein HU200_017335 [Digitaria exilis]
MGARRRMELYHPNPADMLSYHKGQVLHGDIAVSVLWYGPFTQVQKTIVYDFILSLTMMPQAASPSVAKWWNTTNAGGPKKTQVLLADQVSDDNCTMGKSLTLAQISSLAARAKPKKGGVALVFTAQDVTVEGFCMSQCGLHGSDAKSGTTCGKHGSAAEAPQSTYIWVGNSATQCPGQCAWPFAQPQYGPQGAPLVAPNGDVGMDGLVMVLATMVAGTVTNPYGDAFYQGPKDAPLEASSACPGVYGSGAYPGFPGNLLVDKTTGASYNANGVNGRKYLLPGLFNPATSTCSTLV